MSLIIYLIIFMSLLLFVIVAIGFLIFSIMFLQSIIKGAPYIPIRDRALKKMIEFADIKPGQKAVDLGSGDGRIVIALANAGAIAYGYEINPILVWWTKYRIKKEGLEGKAFVYRKSFWNEDFSSFDIVTLFGIRKIMKELEGKLDKELKPGAKIMSFGFSFPDWTPIKKEEAVFLYKKK